MKNNYSSPTTKTISSRIRISILAGSDISNNPTSGDVTGNDFPIESRKRFNNTNID